MLPFEPPLEPMLAKAVRCAARGAGLAVRAEVGRVPRPRRSATARGVHLQSRDLKPLNRYFPELRGAAPRAPPRALRGRRRDRDRRRERARLRGAAPAHPPRRLAGRARSPRETPAELVAFDLLALGDRDLRGAPFARAARASSSGARRRDAARAPHARRPRDLAVAEDWFARFEGAGLDGVIAKPRRRRPTSPASAPWSRSSTRAPRTAWSAGFRWHKNGPGTVVGSLLLGLYDDARRPAARRRHARLHDGDAAGSSSTELAPLRENALEGHPWREWARGRAPSTSRHAGRDRAAGAAARTCRGSRCGIERVCEVDVRPPAGRPLPPRDASSCAGGRTSAPRTAATTSSR